jgi:hypothetical protein
VCFGKLVTATLVTVNRGMNLLLFCHFQYPQNTIPKIRLSQELDIQIIGKMTGLSARTLISPCQSHSTYVPYT